MASSVEDDEDLADLLSENDLLSDESMDSASEIDENLEFVDYQNEDQESSNDSNNDDDPFNIDNLTSESENESENDIDIDNDEASNNESTVNKQKSSAMEEDEEEDDIDWDELHSWPQPGDAEPFPSRVVNLERIPISMNEQKLVQTLFHDIPSDCRPLDIRLQHNQYNLSKKDWSEYGKGQMIFDNADIVDEIMPSLKTKQAKNKNKFRLFRKMYLKDMISDHCVHRNLMNKTLRLLFINLHWKCKALNIAQFITTNLMQYKKTNKMDKKINDMLPRKIQMIEDDKGYTTMCAFVDFEDAETASTVLFACHRRKLMERKIFIDWNAYPKRIKTFIKQQKVFETKKNTQTLLVKNLHPTLTKNDMETFVEKHLKKIKNHSVVIGDVHMMHNRNNPLLCGYCLVSFYGSNVFDILQLLLHRMQYKVLMHRSIFVMFIRNQSQFYVYANSNNNLQNAKQKTMELKDKSRFLMFDNLVWNVTKIHLNDFLTQNEEIGLNEEQKIYHSINIIVDSDGYPIGKALIKCFSPQIATKIVEELDGKLCKERRVIIDWCDEQRYKSIAAMHKDSHLDVMDLSSHFSSTKMKFFHDHLFGVVNVSEIRSRTRARSKKKRNNNGENEGNNTEVIAKYKLDVTKKRKDRKTIFQHAKMSAIDERILAEVKKGKTLKAARPHTFGQIRRFERKGKVGEWTKLGMSKGEMMALKKKINWDTGKSVLSKIIASKHTIHRKDYWADSLKHARRRTRNKWYIQKTNKHNHHRRKKKNIKKTWK